MLYNEYMHKIIQKAFTLVELLVVIAIIGILSGLIIVGMSASVSNANLAKAQIFSTSLRDSLLGNIVSEWKFDELTVPAMEGQSARDTWSTNNCTLYTGLDGLDKLRTGSSCLYDKCLALDGSNDYLNCGTGSNLSITGAITIAAWVNIDAAKFNEGTSASRAAVVSKWYIATDGGYMFVKEGYAQDRMEFWISDTVAYRELASNSKLSPNTWSHVAVTLSGRNYTFYLNGNADGSGTTDLDLAGSTRSLWIGQRTANGGMLMNGLIDEIRIFNASVPASWIREDYYSGVNRLLANKLITSDDYEQRLEGIRLAEK